MFRVTQTKSGMKYFKDVKQQVYLLDTNICIYILRGMYGMNERVKSVGGMDNCYISEITVAELKCGKIYGELKGGPKYKDQKLDEFFASIKVLPISSVIDLFAEEKAKFKSSGTPVSDFDLLIGCTAVFNNMTLVTQNVRDFKSIKNISIDNWIE